MDIEGLLSNDLFVDDFSNTSVVWSDSDDDVYMQCPDDYEEETYDDTPISVSCDAPCDSFDVEIIEEINIDPNSNLSCSQNLQKQLKPTTLSQNDTDSVESSQSPWSILEDTVSNLLDKKIKEEALQICNLLPALKYESVYEILHRNREAENRIELSLWDLLPIKRPRVKNCQDLSAQVKRFKQSDKQVNGSIHAVSNGSLSSQTASSSRDNGNKEAEVQTNGKNTMDTKLKKRSAKSSKVPSTTEGGILRPAKLIINDKSACTERVTSRKSFTLTPPKLTNVTAKRLQNENVTKSSTCIAEDENNKSINQKYTPLGRNVFMSNSRQGKCTEQILPKYMQYLEYMQTVKKRKLSGAFGHFDFEKRNQMRREFLTQNSNVSQNVPKGINKNKTLNNIAKPSTAGVTFSVPDEERLLEGGAKKIALPFKFMQMYETLVFIFPQVDTNPIRQICKNLSKLEDTSSIEKLQTLAEHTLSTIIDFANLFASMKVNIPSADTTVSAITDTNTSLRPVSSTRFTSNNTVTNSNNLLPRNRPSTSPAVYTVFERNQVIGGTKKKRMIEKEGSKSNKSVERDNITLPPKYEEMYETLALMFPQLDKNFIRQTCKNVSKVEGICSFEKLQMLAEHALEKEEMKSAEIDINSLLQEKNENDQFMYLSGVFPDADPTYLKKVVARARDNPTYILNFIQTQWENPTYPTKEEKLLKQKITQQQEQYTLKFDAKQFLEIFPDPFKYFTNSNRACKLSSDAVEFLKAHFRNIEEHNLNDVYNKKKYNLTLTVQELENLPPYEKLARNVDGWKKCPPEDIPLLQEYAFLVHRDEILQYLNTLEEEGTKEFEELKKRNELLECQCCYNDECVPSKCATCDDGHIFCNPCILEGTKSQLAQGVTRISCFSNCDGEFTVSTLQKILPPTQFSIFIRKKQEAEVMAAGIDGLVSCPFCHFASIPPPEDKVFKCLNPECMKESCRLCKEPNHIPLRCYEKKSDQARRLLEEKMTEALVRKCYNCSRPYFKEDGCNKITCTCGAMMCYICDKAIQSYSHFGPYGCPQMSDNHSINDGTVRAVALRTVEFIKQKDPNVAINAEDLLKYLPSTSDKAITERVKKIVKFAE